MYPKSNLGSDSTNDVESSIVPFVNGSVNSGVEKHNKLTNYEAFITVASKSVPFSISRLVYALNTLGIGWTLAQLGRDEVAAGPIFTSLQYVFVGIPRGFLLSTGVLAGEKNGAQEYEEVGKISRASWKLAGISASISIAMLLSMPAVLKSNGLISASVEHVSESYLSFYAIAVPAILTAVAEQQLAVATKDPKVPLGFSFTYSGLAAGLGIPMTLGYMGKALAGIKGFGISTTISSWLGLLGMRLYYYLKEDYKKYDLFKKHYTSEVNYLKKMLSLGWKFGAQSGAEFANLMGTSFLLSAYSVARNVPALEIAAPSIQLSSAWGLVSLGLGQAQASLIANERGAMKAALKRGDIKSAMNAKENISLIAKYGGIFGASISAVIAAVCLTKPGFFADAFLHNDVSDEQMEQASSLIQINAFSLIFDMLRNVYAGNLKGFKDVNFATIFSFLSMTVGCLLAGASSLYSEDSLPGFMWIRNASVALSMLANVVRWYKFEALEVEQQAEVDRTGIGCSLLSCSFFSGPSKTDIEAGSSEQRRLLNGPSS